MHRMHTLALSTTLLAIALAAPVHADGTRRPSQADRIAQQFLQHDSRAPILVAAHRADWRAAPENSLAAIQSAIDKGIPMVEIDIQRTLDGQLILMHDTMVDRTTNGSGSIAAMSLEQIRALRLRQGLGGNQAPLTDEIVPTIDEVLALSRGRIVLQLDKAWAYRDALYEKLAAAGMVGQAIFKSNAAPAEAEAFMARDSKILYMHILEDANAGDFNRFQAHMPQAFEINYDRLTDAQIQPAYIDTIRRQARIFANTMWKGLSAGYTDEASLRDPELGWASVIERHHASVIQTDNPEALMEYLQPSRPHPAFRKDAATIVQAEDYSTDGKDVGYHDLEDANQGGSVYRAYEGVDVCEQQGAINLCWIRGGEWIKYRFELPRSGYYQVAARVSSPYNPAGLYSLEFDEDGSPFSASVITTTSHQAFEAQPVGPVRYFRAGSHEMLFSVDPSAYQNFNVDYFSFTPR